MKDSKIYIAIACSALVIACGDDGTNPGGRAGAGATTGAGGDSGTNGSGGNLGTGGTLGLGGVFGTGGASGSGGRNPPQSANRPSDYIRNVGFPTLKIELDTQTSLAPRSGVTQQLTDALGTVLDKPGGISVVTDETELPATDDGVWTFAELRALVSEHDDGLQAQGGEITMHTVWLGGNYEQANVLGVAWGNRYIAMFGERIAQLCSGVPVIGNARCPLAEATIWTHEVGHVIGLVDNGVPMVNNHKDPDHGAHDVSDESVMYWAYDGSVDFVEFIGQLTGSTVIPWGEECERDLAAVRE